MTYSPGLAHRISPPPLPARGQTGRSPPAECLPAARIITLKNTCGPWDAKCRNRGQMLPLRWRREIAIVRRDSRAYDQLRPVSSTVPSCARLALTLRGEFIGTIFASRANRMLYRYKRKAFLFARTFY